MLCLYLVQHMLHQIKAQQFYTDLGLYQQCLVQQKIVKIQGLSKAFECFPVLFKADFIFKDFSRKPSKFKYFSSLCKPCNRTMKLKLTVSTDLAQHAKQVSCVFHWLSERLYSYSLYRGTYISDHLIWNLLNEPLAS